MNRIKLWDYPIRIFHWAFALCLSGAIAIAFLVDDDAPLFHLHKLLGLTAGFLLVIRCFIGFFGTRPTRFHGLLFGPIETFRYGLNALIGKARIYSGHNPGTAAAALVMFFATGGLLWTGLAMNGEALKEVHETLAFILLTAIGAHLAGLALHTLYHREWIALSMITGWRNGLPDGAIRSFRPWSGALVLVALVAWSISLFRGYEPTGATVKLPLFGVVSLHGEGHEHARVGSHDLRHEEHEHDDD
ncbi:MAG: cytochrome b/b6 domain-containing protein [Verrucomicrobia bacterium]|nr:cytochrome b/b6 domain-containing protein [Verrucomicrobiota bacterium]